MKKRQEKNKIRKKSFPLVSVIMLVYNAEKFLREAIDSILNQTYKNFEFIIIYDKSEDGSAEIIKDYLKKDKRIRFFKNKKKLGRYKSFEKGVYLAKGEFILMMDSDDVSKKNRIYKEVSFLMKNKEYVVVGSQIKILNEKGKIIGQRVYPKEDEEIRKMIYFKSPFAYPSACIKREILLKIKFYKFYEKFDLAYDYYLWYEVLKYGKGKNLDDFLLYYRISEKQTKFRLLKSQLDDTIQVQKIIFKDKKYIPILAKINHLMLNLLLYLPSKIVYWLFKKIEYKKI